MQFYTNNLSCRLLEQKDKADFCALYTDKKVMRKIAPAFSQEKAQAQFSKCLSLNQHVPFERLTFVIENKQGRFCGIQGLVWADAGACKAEAGIMLQQRASGKGVARNSIAALLDIAFGQMQLTQVFACFSPENIPVERFVKKLGFIVETELVEHHGQQMKYCHIEPDIWKESIYQNQTTLISLNTNKTTKYAVNL